MLSLYTVRKTRHALAAKAPVAAAAADDVCVPTYYNNFITESAVLLYCYTRAFIPIYVYVRVWHVCERDFEERIIFITVAVVVVIISHYT